MTAFILSFIHVLFTCMLFIICGSMFRVAPADVQAYTNKAGICG